MENNKQVKDAYRSALKKKAMAFMPKNYEDVNAQRQILSMIVAVIPAAAGIPKAAENGLWPKVQAKTLPIIQAVGQCALEINKAIAAAPLESLLLEKRSNEALLKAWVALDYYAYLMLPEYSGNIRALRDRLLAILRQRDTGAAPAAAKPAAKPAVPVQPAVKPAAPVQMPVKPPVAPPVAPVPQPPMGQAEDINKTVMVERAPAMAEELNKTVTVEKEPEIPSKTQFTPHQDSNMFQSAAEEIGSTVSVAREEVSQIHQDKKKSGSKAPIIIVAAVVAVVAVVIGMVAMGGKAVDKVEEAISAIGTVTLESRDEIQAAEDLYEDLSAGNQEKVENRDTLFAARTEYDRQAAAVSEVEEAISAIGTPVSLNSGDAVKKARKLYDALEESLKDGVSNYADLTSKESEYDKLYNEDRADYLYTAAQKDYEAGNYDAAITKLNELLDKHPGTSVDAKAKALGANCVVVSAQTAMNENRLEDAMKLLKLAERDYITTQETTALRETLVTRINAIRPANGKMFRITTEQGYCKMVITAEDSDICIKLISKANADKYALYYIREGETFSMYLKDGEYTMHYAYGDYWYGEEAMFGEDGIYKKMNADFDLQTTYSGYTVTYEYYEFTLNVHGDWSANTITRDQF